MEGGWRRAVESPAGDKGEEGKKVVLVLHHHSSPSSIILSPSSRN
jgi:hypothetical protein